MTRHGDADPGARRARLGLVVAVVTALTLGATDVAVLAREGQHGTTVDAQAEPAPAPIPVPTLAPPVLVVPPPVVRPVPGHVITAATARPVRAVTERKSASSTAAHPGHDASRRHPSDRAAGHDEHSDAHVAVAPAQPRTRSAAPAAPSAAPADRRRGAARPPTGPRRRPPVVLGLLHHVLARHVR